LFAQIISAAAEVARATIQTSELAGIPTVLTFVIKKLVVFTLKCYSLFLMRKLFLEYVFSFLKSTLSTMNIANSISQEVITSKIYLIRGLRIMLDSDLAELYGVETKVLNQAVKRNMDRFPEDFMFELSEKEFANLRSQFVTSSWGGRRNLPNVFTEQGVAMLSSVLKSENAIKVNIQIVRIFTKMRELLLSNKDILERIEKIEMKSLDRDEEIKRIFSYLKELLNPVKENPKPIGYRRKSN
jgi:hypothetical protein